MNTKMRAKHDSETAGVQPASGAKIDKRKLPRAPMSAEAREKCRAARLAVIERQRAAKRGEQPAAEKPKAAPAPDPLAIAKAAAADRAREIEALIAIAKAAENLHPKRASMIREDVLDILAEL